MKKNTINLLPVILSGGTGSRLWPYSRQFLPKPFAPLFTPPLFEQTLNRVNPWGDPCIVTNQNLKALTEQALKNTKTKALTLYEPLGKNTAPALAWLCWELLQKNQGEKILAIFPSDHLIEKEDLFYEDIEEAAHIAAQGFVVTLGITPNKPETGFGYIEPSLPLNPSLLPSLPSLPLSSSLSSSSRASLVKAFHEKPDVTTAELYLKKGFLWNAGIFVTSVQTLWSHFERLAPEISDLFKTLHPDHSNLSILYENLRSISLDYALMEKLKPSELAVLPVRFWWSDLGTWDSIVESSAPKKAVTMIASENIHVYGLEKKIYTSVGVQDLIIVDTDDALLVTKTHESQKVSLLYETLQKEHPENLERHTFEQRPWGFFKVIHETLNSKTKVITVFPQGQLSYQSHEHRSEHWIVTQGKAEIILDDQVHHLKKRDSIFIHPKQKHRLKNIGQDLLTIVEVQMGDNLSENDITRYEDNYGRM
jgi:mannose-1-phosphate guanylyltransferase/mannose-6-phosphate isomerase